jgi:Protein of unknown function (DUF4230)
MTALITFIGMVVGGIAAWQIFHWIYGKKLKDKSNEVRQEATVLLERIEKVFKVVVSEGYFTEIYDHYSKKEFLGLLLTNKKALVVVKAKVSIGFDFAKMKVRRDENTRKLIVEYFPEAEILSVDTDYKFYDINQGFLNQFNHEDYTKILTEAKKVMQEKALQSDLPKTANKQIGLMMTQLAASMNWDVDFLPVISPQKTLPNNDFVDFQEVKE